MAKLAPTSIKYVIKASIKAKGVIEKPDVIGAVFGQTEGLLGSDLNLRELQETGRIGRVEVNVKSKSGESEGEIIIPSSLDAAETALIAATLETIERVGPCTADIKVTTVEDTRSDKRKYVVDKAKEILKGLVDSGVPDADGLSEEIKEAVRSHEITSFHGLPCGPNMEDSGEMIIVEGRADIINLLRHGIRNTIAIEGASVPDVVKEISREKETTAFMDGDRGGQLNLKGLMETADIDFVAIAPEGKEVEELSKKEIYKALREKTPAAQFKFDRRRTVPKREERAKIKRTPSRSRERETRPARDRKPRTFEKRVPRLGKEQKESFRKMLTDLVGTRAACIFDSKEQLLGKVPVSELINTLRTIDSPHTIVFDGKVDQKLNGIAMDKGVKYLVAMEKEDLHSSVTILSKKDLE
ncbi:MAG: DNA primase [Candidatus Aenigmatarchaeota archaeon]|nr:MAG: DNA primase [Candidatus Aenigmarchaeota archaeon]